MSYPAAVVALLAGIGSWLLGWHVVAVVLYVAAAGAYAQWYRGILRTEPGRP